MTKLVIFDLDGTLLNTLEDLSAAANAALVCCGFATRTREEIQSFLGNGVVKLLMRALPVGQQTPENIARIKQSFFIYYGTHLWDYTQPYDGIVALLGQLQHRKIKMAVASNKYQLATERLIKHFFPQVPFYSILGQREGHPIKPHPAVVQDIFTQAKVDPAEVLYVGDSETDMQTAANAKVRACGVLWGFRSREILESYSPTYLISHPQELLRVI